MAQRFVVSLALGAALVVTGCATKSFVRGEVGKSEARSGEAVGRVGADLSQERARVSGLAVQATEAGAKAGQALTRADEATGAAGQALAKADQTDGRLTRLWSNRNKRTLGDTVLIRFGFDRWQLDDRGQTALLDVVRLLQEQPTLVVDLEGYTDSVGAAPYNIQLSQRRVEAVRRFLVEKGVDLHRIQSIGLGDLRPAADNKTKDGRDQNRRVAVKLFVPVE